MTTSPTGGRRTADVWTSRPVDAQHLLDGDVVADLNGRLWTVSTPSTDAEGAIVAEIARGGVRRPVSWAPTKAVAVLLTADDARGLATVEELLGATEIARSAA